MIPRVAWESLQFFTRLAGTDEVIVANVVVTICGNQVNWIPMHKQLSG